MCIKATEEEVKMGRQADEPSLSDALKGFPVPRSDPDHYISELGYNKDPVTKRSLSKKRTWSESDEAVTVPMW